MQVGGSLQLQAGCLGKMSALIPSEFGFKRKVSPFFFLFGCIGSSLLRVGFPQLRQGGATVHCDARASHCSGFSCCGAQALGERAQQLWLAGSRAQAQQLWRTGLVVPWHVGLPRPGIKPVSPALAGVFLTTAPPGKSPDFPPFKKMYYKIIQTQKCEI